MRADFCGTDITKKVLVTGADGFIGSHLTELLVKEGYKVKAFSFYNTPFVAAAT